MSSHRGFTCVSNLMMVSRHSSWVDFWSLIKVLSAVMTCVCDGFMLPLSSRITTIRDALVMGEGAGRVWFVWVLPIGVVCEGRDWSGIGSSFVMFVGAWLGVWCFWVIVMGLVVLLYGVCSCGCGIHFLGGGFSCCCVSVL